MSGAIVEFEHFFLSRPIAFYLNVNHREDIAQCLMKMHEYSGLSRDRLAERFFKSNLGLVSFSDNHQGYSELSYIIKVSENGMVEVKEQMRNASGEKKVSVFFTGHYAEFVNTYTNGSSFHLLSKEALQHSNGPYILLKEIDSRIKSTTMLWVHTGNEYYRNLMTLWIAEYHRIVKAQHI
ncbi:MAG: hypothetical protein K0S08_682 [Gammaproteobacteria bacterium]|nr:hypothetical protein [Gammaproteobacteria bacterium]